MRVWSLSRLGTSRLVAARVRSATSRAQRPLWTLAVGLASETARRPTRGSRAGGKGARAAALTLSTTAEHSFRSPRGWVRADRLRPGDRVLVLGEMGLAEWTVVASRPAGHRARVFNLHVEGTATFLVGGCVVHGFSFARGPRTSAAALVTLAARIAARAQRLRAASGVSQKFASLCCVTLRSWQGAVTTRIGGYSEELQRGHGRKGAKDMMRTSDSPH